MVRGGDNRGVRGGASRVGMASRVYKGAFDLVVRKFIYMLNGSPPKHAHAILGLDGLRQVGRVLLAGGEVDAFGR